MQRLVELLKQSQYAPLAVEKQVAGLYIGTHGYLDDVPVDKIVFVEHHFYEYLDAHHSDLLKGIAEKKILDEDMEAKLDKACEAFIKQLKVE